MKYLSQTCTSFQDIFRPLSWRFCIGHDRDMEISQIPAYTYNTVYCLAPAKMIITPQKYSRFHKDKVLLINSVNFFEICVVIFSPGQLEPFFDIFKFFPLRKVNAFITHIRDIPNELFDNDDPSFALKYNQHAMKKYSARFQDILDLSVLNYPVSYGTLPIPASAWKPASCWNRVHIKKNPTF